MSHSSSLGKAEETRPSRWPWRPSIRSKKNKKSSRPSSVDSEKSTRTSKTGQAEFEQPAPEGSPLQTAETLPASRNAPLLFETEFKKWKRDHGLPYETWEHELQDPGLIKWDDLVSFSIPEGQAQTNALFKRLKSQLPSLASIKGIVMSLSNLDPHKIAPLLCAACFFAIEISLNVPDPQFRDKILDRLCSTTGIINRWILYEKYSMNNAKSAVTGEMEELRLQLPPLYSKALEIISSLHADSRRILSRVNGKPQVWDTMCADLNRQHKECGEIAAEAEEKIKNQDKSKEILDWIADPDPNVRHETVKDGINKANPSPLDDLPPPDGLPPQIGDWFITTTEFQAWAQGTRPEQQTKRYFWLKGSMGTGKTTLTCKVICYFQAFFSEKVELAYYYCFGSRTSADGKGPSYETIIRALCHQLASSSDGIRTPVLKLYDDCTSGSNKPPTIDQWESLLDGLLTSTASPVVFVIDALDECKDQKDQLDFLTLITRLHAKYPRLHIFFSSRDRKRPTDLLMSYIQTFEAKSHAADPDMERFIKRQLELRKTEDPESQIGHHKSIFISDLGYHRRLSLALSRTANGMYRWVEVWIGVFFPPFGHIDRHTVAKKLLKQLEEFQNPKTERPEQLVEKLDVAYRFLWESNAGDHGSDLQNQIFHLVLCTFRPLTPDQLLHAVRFNPQEPDTWEDKMEIEDVQRRYHNFLSIDSKGFLQFEHVSAKAFVLGIKEKDSKYVWEAKSPEQPLFSEWRNHQLMAVIAITMLQNLNHPLWEGSGIDLLDWRARLSREENFERILDGIRTSRSEEADIEILESECPGLTKIQYPEHFAQYLMRNWTRHCRLAQLDNNKPVENMKLSKLPGFQGWCCGLAIFAKTWSLQSDVFEVASSVMDSLRRIEDGEIVVDPFLYFLNFGNCPSVIDEQEVRSLAAIANKEGLRSLSGKTPLHIACSHDNSEIVKIIIEGGGNVDVDEGEYGNALHIASEEGCVEVVRLLIKEGVDVNAKRKLNNTTALYVASSSGHLKVVQMLIEAGADVNQEGGRYGSALQAAAVADSVEAVKLLIEAKANVNQEGGRYGSALQGAAVADSVEAVKLLIEAKANVNQEGGRYGSALQGAAVTGSVEAVKVLIKAGADVNAKGGEPPTTALIVASMDGQLEIMKLLIKAGADVNAKGGHSLTTALTVASMDGQLEIMKLLIKAGADVNAKGGDFRTALEAAKQSVLGGTEAVELLLQAGAKEDEES